MNYLINLFRSSSVRAEIMAVLNQRIDQAEETFRAGATDIKNQLAIDLKIAKENAQSKTTTLLRKIVKDVLGDVLR